MSKKLFVATILFTCLAIGVFAFQHDGWTDGYYYDLTGNKITGLITDHPIVKQLFGKDDDDFIMFKKDKADKKVKVTTNEIKAYVVGADSFVVTHSPLINKVTFLRVEFNGPVKLYTARYYVNNGTTGGDANKYYYGENPDNLTLVERKNFIEAMAQVLASRQDLAQRIQTKQIRFGGLGYLIDSLNVVKAQEIFYRNRHKQ